MTIYLIRHTEVAVGRSICYGGSDVALADNYAEQLAHIQTNLATPPNVIWASPLSRCRQLAQDLALASEVADVVEVNFDDRLREYHFGDWEMLPWSDIPRDALDQWMSDFVQLAPPNGETFQALADRVGAFWQEKIEPMVEKHPNGTIYVVSHGGVIRTLLCLFLDLSLRNAYRLNLDYGAVCKLTLTGSTYQIGYINR
ncbi:alpha-ribazole phosphatase [Fibrella aestuarina]|nr:alpha-ribazole phosphatase [Fibrella aestuarina]